MRLVIISVQRSRSKRGGLNKKIKMTACKNRTREARGKKDGTYII